jgi:hypothetical protein
MRTSRLHFEAPEFNKTLYSLREPVQIRYPAHPEFNPRFAKLSRAIWASGPEPVLSAEVPEFVGKGSFLGAGISECCLLVKNDIEQTAINFDTSIIFNKAQLPKSIHEEADS